MYSLQAGLIYLKNALTERDTDVLALQNLRAACCQEPLHSVEGSFGPYPVGTYYGNNIVVVSVQLHDVAWTMLHHCINVCCVDSRNLICQDLVILSNNGTDLTVACLSDIMIVDLLMLS